MKSFSQFLFVLTIISFIVSCGGESSGPGTGELSLNITDAPVRQADAVVVFVEKALVHSAEDGNVEIDVLDPGTGLPGRSIDLLQLTGDRSIELFNHTFSEGTISWTRLSVDFDPLKTYIQIDGTRYPLRCVSCERNGIRLVSSMEVIADTAVSYTLDFDLQKSITDPQSGIDYILRPTIRVVKTSATGSIRGNVDATLISSLGGSPGCAVYVYDGNDSVTDDIYMPTTMPLPATHNNPVTVAPVELSPSNELYGYHAAFLPEGNYTIALTCDAETDDPELDDTSLTFYGAVNKFVASGQTTEHDFNTVLP